MKKSKLLYGVGINDSDYVVGKKVNGKLVFCNFYLYWRNMLQRCYSDKLKEKYPTYKDCTVCDEWLTFSNFKEWMDNQYWYGMQLDKDLLVNGNKFYSPETCIFISMQLNKFTTESSANRGNYPLGVSLHKQSGKYRATCNNPFAGRIESLGLFNCPDEAHQAWKARKHELSCQWADIVGDERLKHALRNRYL